MDNLKLYFMEELIDLKNLGRDDKKVFKDTEAILCLRIKDAMLKSHFKMRVGNVLMVFNGKSYEAFKSEDFEQLMQSTLEALGVGKVYIVNSISAISRTCYIGMLAKPFELDKKYICFQNVVVHLDTLEVLDHSQDINTDFIMPYDYDPKADCPIFKDHLSMVLPNAGVRRVLHEFSGAFLMDRKDLKIDQVCFLIGTGLNGKGVFIQALYDTLGEDANCGSYTMHSLTTHSRHEYYRAAVDGKLANFDFDGSKGDYSGGDYKKLASGEPIDARSIQKSPYIATHMPLIMAAVNEPPVTTDNTAGHHRRNLWIPFEVTIAQKDIDRTLSVKIKEERPGIFNWLMEGRDYIRDQKGKFSYSEKIESLSSEIRTNGHTILMFLEYKGWVPTSSKAPELMLVGDMYEEYVSYCESNRNKGIFQKQNFGRFLVQEGFEQKRTTRGQAYFVHEGIEEKEGDFLPLKEDDDYVPF